MTNIKKHRLSPLLKRAWWKEQELKHILPNLPEDFHNFYEPFIWWGAVYFSLKSKKYFINDKSEELIWLYKIITSKNRDDFFQILDEIIHNWKLLWKILDNNGYYIKSVDLKKLIYNAVISLKII